MLKCSLTLTHGQTYFESWLLNLPWALLQPKPSKHNVHSTHSALVQPYLWYWVQYWRESSQGPLRRWKEWPISPVRRGWESWDCSALEKRRLWGSHQCIPVTEGKVQTGGSHHSFPTLPFLVETGIGCLGKESPISQRNASFPLPNPPAPFHLPVSCGVGTPNSHHCA